MKSLTRARIALANAIPMTAALAPMAGASTITYDINFAIGGTEPYGPGYTEDPIGATIEMEVPLNFVLDLRRCFCRSREAMKKPIETPFLLA